MSISFNPQQFVELAQQYAPGLFTYNAPVAEAAAPVVAAAAEVAAPVVAAAAEVAAQALAGGAPVGAPSPATRIIGHVVRAGPHLLALGKGIANHAYLSTIGAVSAIGGAMLVLPETVQNYVGGAVSSTSVQLGGGLANGTAAVLSNALVPAVKEAFKQATPAAVEIVGGVISDVAGTVAQTAGNLVKTAASDPIGTVGAYCNLDAAANKKELFSWIYEQSTAKLQELTPVVISYGEEFKNRFSETFADKRNTDALFLMLFATAALTFAIHGYKYAKKQEEAQQAAMAQQQNGQVQQKNAGTEQVTASQ